MKKFYALSVIAIGLISVVFQLLFMREIASVFLGNELVFGLCLSAWLILSYLGYLVAHRIKQTDKVVELLIIIGGVLPVCTILIIRLVTYKIFLHGVIVPPTLMYLYILLLLLPFCILNGAFVILIARVFQKKKYSKKPSFVVFLDNLGDGLAGVIFSFVLVFIFNTMQIAQILFLLALLVVFFTKTRISKITYLLLIIATIIAINLDIDKHTIAFLYPYQEIVANKFTPFGNIVLTKTNEQYNLFENGLLYASTQDYFIAESIVHLPLLQLNKTENLLLISGGLTGALNEALKYDFKHIDYVELDPEIISLGLKYFSLPSDKRISYYSTDGVLFLKQTNETYDGVILSIGTPTNAQSNRFYTDEFIKLVKKKLNKGGVFSFSIQGGENYLSSELATMHSILLKTALKHFKHFIVIPSEETYYIFSDAKLSYNFTKLIGKHHIATRFVKPEYLDAIINKERVTSFLSHLSKNVSLNKDFKPAAYYYVVLTWMKQFNLGLLPIIVLLITLLLLVIPILEPSTYIAFTSGFIGLSVEFMLTLVFQITYGYVYSQLGLVVASFMFGLVLGSYLALKLKKVKKHYIAWSELFILFLLVCLFLKKYSILKKMRRL